jgi:hypothetical protein
MSRVKNHQTTRWIAAERGLSSLVASVEADDDLRGYFRMPNRERYALTILAKRNCKRAEVIAYRHEIG